MSDALVPILHVTLTSQLGNMNANIRPHFGLLYNIICQETSSMWCVAVYFISLVFQ